MTDVKTPKPLHVQRLRSKVQKDLSLNINQARCWCAAAALVDPSNWLSWETGDFEMPVAVWQLVQVKALLFNSDLLRVNLDVPGVRYTQGLPVFHDFGVQKKWERPTINDQAKTATKRKKGP
jgi:hypothetical protein